MKDAKGKQRRVPIGSYAAAALEAYLVRSRPVLLTLSRPRKSSRSLVRNNVLSRSNRHNWIDMWLHQKSSYKRRAD